MKKILVLTLAIAFVLGNGFFMFEGVMASAATVTSTDGQENGHPSTAISIPYNVQLSVDSEMSLTCDTSTPVSMAGDLDGMTGGVATGTRSCTAVTNNEAGYTMQAAVTAMTSIEDAADFFGAEAAGATWTAPAAGAGSFGYKGPEGGWVGSGGSAATIASTTEESTISGDSVKVDYEAEVTGPALFVSGLYQATTTISLFMN